MEKKYCQNCKQEFQIEAEDIAFYQKIQVPPPTFCPGCRLKRRLAWRNGRLLFRRKNDAYPSTGSGQAGREIFSGFPGQAGGKVYDHEYWKSDAWDAMAYGRDYDFSKTFFEQYRDLLYCVPWPSKSVQGMVDSEYSDQAGFFKNSYLCFNGDKMEDSAYTTQCSEGKSCFDSSLSNGNELCYECVSVNGSYGCVYSEDCQNSVDVWFSKNCNGCSHCFGSVNLRDKQYYFFNQPLSKEEYERQVAELRINTFAGLDLALNRTREFFLKHPVKYFHGFRIVNSSGDYLRNVKNVRESYFADGAEDSKFLFNVYMGTRDSYDYGPWGNGSSLMYECMTCGDQGYGEKFCLESWPACRDLEYCFFCRSSSDCFGCVSLKKKQFCILNKQYSEEEYHDLRKKIIQQMNEKPYVSKAGITDNELRRIEYRYGEFMPPEFSPFAYNECALQDFWPLTKEDAERGGFLWRDPDSREYETTLDAGNLPGSIEEVEEGILREIIRCGSCRKAYRIIGMELQYLRRMKLPLPRVCVSCRLARRNSLINPPEYYARGCAKCGIEFKTSYAPDKPQIVYCEACYQAEVA